MNDREENLPVFRRRADDQRTVAEREWKAGLKPTKPQSSATMACSAMRRGSSIFRWLASLRDFSAA